MNVLDLFSGIGGFSLGLERAGFRTVAFCEREPFCQTVLARWWPDVPCYGDVRELTANRLKADGISVDAICGGFPCQDISAAGKGAGLEGERSGLWFEYARLISEIRPVFAIIENVPRLRTLGADRVLSDLEELGYTAEPFVVGAVHAGAPHRRQRAWIVAHANGEQLRKQPGRSGRPRWPETSFASEHGAERSVAYADSQPLERPSIARAQCRPWDTEPDVGRVVDGLPAALVEDELRALGNAVVPQIPELIGRAIMTALQHSQRMTNAGDAP
ncbi:DNA cytosine methyltransferase [Bradyrhizobium elkanii]|uniref:DNA cytosine methyltransferase n=1 Tax=Bradyrhizobium elkanii TaxID=29448 RepID=UPI0035120E34